MRIPTPVRVSLPAPSAPGRPAPRNAAPRPGGIRPAICPPLNVVDDLIPGILEAMGPAAVLNLARTNRDCFQTIRTYCQDNMFNPECNDFVLAGLIY